MMSSGGYENKQTRMLMLTNSVFNPLAIIFLCIVAAHRITSGYKCCTSMKPQKILNSRVFTLRKVIGLGGSQGCVCTCTGKKTINGMHKVSSKYLLSLKYSFSSSAKPVCPFSSQSDDLTWLVVVISRVKRCPRRPSTNCESLSSLPLESQGQAPDIVSPHVQQLCSKRSEKRTFTSLAMFMGQLECKMRIYTGWKVYFNLQVCYIFFFHHTALQIILVLFLWCIKLVHCQVSALHSGSGIKALGQFYFICICCQSNVFILKCPSHINFSGGLTDVESVRKKTLPHAALCSIAFMFSPSLRGEMYNTR